MSNVSGNLTTVTMTGKHDVMGWGTFDELRGSLLPRIFGYLVQMAAPVVKEYHGDLFHDAAWLRGSVNGPTSFLFCVRYSGTNIGGSAQSMFDSVDYDAVLYNVDLSTDDRGRWSLTIDVIEARPVRPTD